jgi:ribosomal protein S27AE
VGWKISCQEAQKICDYYAVPGGDGTWRKKDGTPLVDWRSGVIAFRNHAKDFTKPSAEGGVVNRPRSCDRCGVTIPRGELCDTCTAKINADNLARKSTACSLCGSMGAAVMEAGGSPVCGKCYLDRKSPESETEAEQPEEPEEATT